MKLIPKLTALLLASTLALAFTPRQMAVALKGTPTPTRTAQPGATATRTPTRTPTGIAPTATPPSGGGGNPVTCAGYSPARYPLETQAWWLQTPGRSGTDHGHIHLFTCFPYAATISGNVVFDIKLVLHDNPGEAYLLLVDGASDSGTHSLLSQPISFTCSAETCERWYRVTVDTARIPYNGRQEFRFRAKVRFTGDSSVMFPTTGWQANLANPGKPTNDYRSSNLTICRGWYTGAEYANATLESALPTAPLSGVWSPRVSMKPGSGGIPVTHHLAVLDADFHAGIPGTVLRDGPGQFDGTLTIDTRQLSNGAHKLLLRADANHSSGSTNSGVCVIRFTVSN